MYFSNGRLATLVQRWMMESGRRCAGWRRRRYKSSRGGTVRDRRGVDETRVVYVQGAVAPVRMRGPTLSAEQNCRSRDAQSQYGSSRWTDDDDDCVAREQVLSAYPIYTTNRAVGATDTTYYLWEVFLVNYIVYVAVFNSSSGSVLCIACFG